MKYDRINKQICFCPSFEVKCPSCYAEYQLVDCIAGNIFTEAHTMYCAVCGEEISMGRGEAK